MTRGRDYIFLVLLLAMSQSARPVSAQDTARAPRFYVVKAVGEWVVFDDKHPATPLRALVSVPRNARLGVRPDAHVDTSHVLVLRDPRSLLTATWACQPIGRCRGERQALQLTFAGPAMTPSSRVERLFVHLDGDPETRARVKLVGARGEVQDWGMTVLSSDSRGVDTAPITAKVGGDRAGVVLRFCALGTSRPNEDCDNASRTECEAEASTPCRLRLGGARATAMLVQILVRSASGSAGPPMASTIAIVTTPRSHAAISHLTSQYWTDLVAIRSYVTDEELRALSIAAALEISRPRS